MKITKGSIEFTVSERLKYWLVSYSADKLAVDYQVAKTECETFEELEKYILTSEHFGG